MSCWVVPSIAAEFWRVPLDHVLDQLRRNALPVRQENGFTFIDILPDPAPATPLPRDRRPPTYAAAPLPQPAIPDGSISHNPTRLQTSSLRRAPALS
jgi:hypothetical protein